MHPAFSVVFFTTFSGAGYGLLGMLSVFAALGLIPPGRWLGLSGIGLAFGLVTGGLLASTFHLGRPERAWRAFSQWRTSWLSREAVASVVTYFPTGVLAIGWILLERTDGVFAAAAISAAVCAGLTVAATGMIYASLKPIAQWNSPYTVPGYLIYSLMTGSVLLNAILQIWRLSDSAIQIAAPFAIALGWVWKTASWRYNDALAAKTSVNSAVGLVGGNVRCVEWPHTEENYILKEMGYRIARRHAAKLRLVVHAAAFALPLVGTLVATLGSGPVTVAVTIAAVLVQLPGMLVERWLFFAEARHTVALYYGR
jgi:sulfite dehydrogenase (quinone) subunit SoeC